jgi:hypothetical protein
VPSIPVGSGSARSALAPIEHFPAFLLMIGLIDLLRLRGFDPSIPTKLVRHESRRDDVRELLRMGWMDAYQSFQMLPIFHKVRQIVSFVGEGGTRARLVGVYRVRGHRAARHGVLPPGCPYKRWLNDKYFYDLDRLPAFDDLVDRIVIDWGRGTRAWHQRLREREVLEILPPGRSLEPPADYLEFTLTFQELRHLVKHSAANREWRARLSAVAGVYLILASTTGAQYVGSAYGAEGIWGRWSSYVSDGHGGNALLRKLVENDRAYPDAFMFSLLQILPTSTARADVISREGRFKQKLGSRAIGLNAN